MPTTSPATTPPDNPFLTLAFNGKVSDAVGDAVGTEVGADVSEISLHVLSDVAVGASSCWYAVPSQTVKSKTI